MSVEHLLTARELNIRRLLRLGRTPFQVRGIYGDDLKNVREVHEVIAKLQSYDSL